jgi:superfamily II DNA or RNA helicase
MEIIQSNNYTIKGILAKYGFCIKKSLYPPSLLNLVKLSFTVKPKLMFDDINEKEDNSFDVFFEDEVYLVIPKFFSNSYLKINFTDTTTNKIYDKVIFEISKIHYKYKTTNFNFTGKLRDYQNIIVDSILKNFGLENNSGVLSEIDKTLKPKGGIIQLSTGAGKCLAKNTNVLMFDGSIKKVQDITINDILMGDDSQPRNILSLAQGKELMYKISIKNNNVDKFNTDYVVNETHILSLKYKCDLSTNNYSIRDISIKDYLNLNDTEQKKYFGYRVPIHFNNKKIPFDAYEFGKILIQHHTIDNIVNSDYYLSFSPFFIKNKDFKDYFIKNDLFLNPFIPNKYKYNSEKVRLDLLAGLIDGGITDLWSNKHYNGSFLKIKKCQEKFIDDIIYLIRSLGFCLEIYESSDFFDKYEIKICNSCKRKLPLKLCGECLITKNPDICIHDVNNIIDENHLLYEFNLIKLHEDEYYGFEIDGNKRFVLGDFTVTHNTVLAIYLSYILKLKTLIIVHQEFLQDQWIERFNMFTDAKIGTIRGQIIDTENKDVVIGMLQSISIKDYEDNVFSDFGLVIYDEVHHFGSKVFSRALLKTSAKYNIGLSATPERMDGLIKVVKWFTGDILYKMEKKYDYKVLVKKLYFRSQDPLYKEKSNWIAGKIRPNHVKMTSNIMNTNTRNKLLINCINCLKSMGRTIFVISSRVEHLQILKNGVDLLIKQAGEQHIYNTYYYIGPTKKGQKKMAEKDGNIIFATIQLASEALDIPRLDTIVLALPIKQDKTLIQSIGRILRNDKLESLTQIPVVIDIADTMSIYQKWSEKRDLVYNTKNWFIQNYYWDDEDYLYRAKDDKKLKPMNIIFDNIEDEDFIEKNLIINK